MNIHLSVITIVYPAVHRFLSEFFNSLKNQTDKSFQLWIGLDGVNPNELEPFLTDFSDVHLLTAPANSTPANVRNLVLEKALKKTDAVALVDSDDILFPTRIEAAKKSAEKRDVTAAAMKYIDEKGKPLTGFFDPSRSDPTLVRSNGFGFSNATWRSETLSRFIPVPESCVLMDWYVSTLAYLTGSTMGYDNIPRMYYRQYFQNIVQVSRQLTKAQLKKSIRLVRDHYDLLLKNKTVINGGFSDIFINAKRRVERFDKAVTDSGIADNYVTAFNLLPKNHGWWDCVAHPGLEDIWEKSQ